ncbi:hypothetical protein [Kitasatospora azatica]|uniref:hypothetical protein n=1 Tax=Kitasatospora azatica TaxID=58347 RepID=UPI000691607A|nr:hypothetical protein [Kitasatospora azatica]
MRLRLGIGAIGFLLPIALPLGNWIFVRLGHRTEILPSSMSDSYYTSTRNILVGSLCALGVFLIGYRYNKRDDVWSTVAGCFAIGVALFPTVPKSPTDYQAAVGVLHVIFAAVLLSALAMFCIQSFRDPAIEARRTVNQAYLAAGVLIFVFLAIAVITGVTGLGAHWTLTPLYLCEALSVWAFGAAWIGAAVELGALARTGAQLRRLRNRPASG